MFEWTSSIVGSISCISMIVSLSHSEPTVSQLFDCSWDSPNRLQSVSAYRWWIHSNNYIRQMVHVKSQNAVQSSMIRAVHSLFQEIVSLANSLLFSSCMEYARIKFKYWICSSYCSVFLMSYMFSDSLLEVTYCIAFRTSMLSVPPKCFRKLNVHCIPLYFAYLVEEVFGVLLKKKFEGNSCSGSFL